MHLLESQALTCGSKIDKPYIYKNFFPLPYEKFIVFVPNNKIPSKDFIYYQDVINHIFPQLEKESIKILHLGQKDSLNYNGTVNLCGRTSSSNAAYLIEKALLFFGTDGFEVQIAGAANVPIVSINSSTYKENTGPFFGDKDKQVVFESYLRIGNKKPSFNVNEVPRSINLIKPEEISNAILKLLNLNFKMPIETVFTGERYSHFTIQESLADSTKCVFSPDNLIEIETDTKDFSEENLSAQLAHYKKTLLITDKPLNLSILKNFKPHIESLVYKITKDNLNPEFLNSVRALGIKLILISYMSQSDIDLMKIHYYELGSINKIKEYAPEFINELKKDIDKLYYRSAKVIASNGQVYYSLAAQEQGVPLQNNFEYQKVIDLPSFWENIDFFTIVKLIS